jgi:hypothetical protein
MVACANVAVVRSVMVCFSWVSDAGNGKQRGYLRRHYNAVLCYYWLMLILFRSVVAAGNLLASASERTVGCGQRA